MAPRYNAGSQHDYPSSFLDALYCSEQHWEGEEEEDIVENEYDSRNPVSLSEQDLFWDDDELVSLLSKELPNQLHTFLLKNPQLSASRREAVEWMLKVNNRYSFSALTAVLAVDYFDRFISSFHWQRETPWMTQLVAVACISLAAKVEETQVPLLLDLQVEASSFVFEAKTIKRMEILVLSTLQWRMNPVNPLSFLDYITRRLELRASLCCEFLRRCEQTLLSAILDSRLTSYLSSVIASATILYVINCLEPRLGLQFQNQLLGIIGVNKEKVDDCYALILEASEEHGAKSNKRKFGSSPDSPIGVIDLSLSPDCSNDSWSVASSSPERVSKKLRPEDQLRGKVNKTGAVGHLTIPH